ncbi:uncharacterized protein LOC141533036 [Cotesia typhae]|uniref:uncharacterized protein LOC141533036 n=1 Tax=Cotesia typhae TaxID=2053667 RepID=UPI003D69EFAB
MKRGPYKSYLNQDVAGIMPRSTFYYKLKKLRCDTSDEDNETVNQNIIDYNMDANEALLSTEVSTNGSCLSVEYRTERDARLINLQRSSPENSEIDLWLYEDEDEESSNRDKWFDAEDTPPAQDFNADRSKTDQTSFDHTADDIYSKPLCSCTSITRGEVLMMTLLLGAQESLTWETMTKILSMINTIFGDKIIPSTKFKLFQLLELNESSFSRHLYCNECFFYFGIRHPLNTDDLICPICKKIFSIPTAPFFLTLNFAHQLKQVLENLEVQEALFNNDNQECNEEENVIRNITDGQTYKKLSNLGPIEILSDKYNLSYTFNTDGCQAAKSSKLSIWPIYASINELPAKLKSKHLIMTGLWVDKVEPDMNLFFKPFVKEANDLSKNGLQWKLGEETITSKFIPLCACFDSVARCKVLNMKQYNGKYGCTFCEHPTKSVNKYRKFPMLERIPPDRSDESIKNQMLLASEKEYREDIKGVWGPSQLMNLKYFDLVGGMSPDYLHSILLGTVKQHTELLLCSFGKSFYVGNPDQLIAINETLLKFKHPSSITRSPRDITDRKMWKATEWRSWLLFYSLISLKKLLPQQYLDHLALLVEAIRILLEEKITSHMLKIADDLLIQYTRSYQKYFGEENMTYNIHLLLHMVKSVMNLGPLWAHNTFSFENENHFILKMKKSPTHVCLQVARKYYFQKSLPLLTTRFQLSNEFNKFCEQNLTGRLKNTLKTDNCVLVGKGKYYKLNEFEKEAIGFTPNECKSYNRFIYDGNRYTSQSYRLCEKINDTIIMLNNGTNGIITNICSLENMSGEDEIVIFYQEIKHTGKFFHCTKRVTVRHIYECKITAKLQTCKPTAIIRPGILHKIQQTYYIINIPKGCYGD